LLPLYPKVYPLGQWLYNHGLPLAGATTAYPLRVLPQYAAPPASPVAGLDLWEGCRALIPEARGTTISSARWISPILGVCL